MRVKQIVLGKRMNTMGSHGTACKTCAQRQLGGSELYEYKCASGRYLFDVEQAKGIATNGRPPELLPPETLQLLLIGNAYEEEHMLHVRPEVPGVLARFADRFLLLDGVHRAARCLRDGLEFRVYVIEEEECSSCLVYEDVT